MADAFGLLAALLVLATFNTTNFRHLRLLGIASNVSFIAYGVMLSLWPVVVLHAVLLPVNAWHLLKLDNGGRRSA